MSYGAAAVMVIAAVVAAGVAAYSTYNQIENQKEQARAEEKARRVDQENALNRAKAQEENSRLRAQRFLSTQKAQMGKTGALAGEGSFLDAELEAASMGEYEALLSGYDSRVEAHRSGYAADLARWQRKRLDSQQWSSTLVAGIGAGVGSAAGSYNSGSLSRNQTPTTAHTNTGGSNLSQYGIGQKNRWDSSW
jgi:hypothetical protein